MRRAKKYGGIANVIRGFWGRERDIAEIKKMVERDTPVPIFIVGAKSVGKSALASRLYERWKKNDEEAIVPVLFRFIGDFVLCDKRTLLEQLSKKVISDCQVKDGGIKDGGIERVQEMDSRPLLDQAEETVRTMCRNKRKVVILVDNWLAILDQCQDLDPRAFGDFLNMGVTRLRQAGATFVFLDSFSRDMLPESIRVKLPVMSLEYYLLPLSYNDLAVAAKKEKEKISQDDEDLWNYVGGYIDLVKGLCIHWKGADAICGNERVMIHNVMDALVRSLARLFVKTREEAVKLLQRFAENPETVVNDPVVKELCRMGVIDSSGGGPWMCGAMREYLFSCNGEGARENKKLKVVLKCQDMSVEIDGERLPPFQEERKTDAIQFALLYLLLTDEDRYGHMTYSTFRKDVLGTYQYTPFKALLLKRKERGESRISKLCDCLEEMKPVTRDDVKAAADALKERVFEPLLKIPECHVIPIGRSRDHKTLDDSNWPDFLDIVVVG